LVKKVLILGPTGAGKSTLIQHYTKENVPVVHTLRSGTDKTREYECLINGEKVIVFDTPGFGDSEGRDQTFLNDLVETMRKHNTGIQKVVFAISIWENRINELLHSCLRLLCNLIPELLLPQTRGVFSFLLTFANSSTKSSWEASLVSKQQGYNSVLQQYSLFGEIILVGQSPEDRKTFEEMIKKTDIKTFFQTKFMKDVQTLETQKKIAEQEAARALAEQQRIAQSLLQSQAAAAALQAQQQQQNIAMQQLQDQLKREGGHHRGHCHGGGHHHHGRGHHHGGGGGHHRGGGHCHRH